MTKWFVENLLALSRSANKVPFSKSKGPSSKVSVKCANYATTNLINVLV